MSDVVDYGMTDSGRKVHLVDFDTDSMLALGNDDPDAAVCGITGNFERVASSDSGGDYELCQKCDKRN